MKFCSVCFSEFAKVLSLHHLYMVTRNSDWFDMTIILSGCSSIHSINFCVSSDSCFIRSGLLCLTSFMASGDSKFFLEILIFHYELILINEAGKVSQAFRFLVFRVATNIIRAATFTFFYTR